MARNCRSAILGFAHTLVRRIGRNRIMIAQNMHFDFAEKVLIGPMQEYADTFPLQLHCSAPSDISACQSVQCNDIKRSIYLVNSAATWLVLERGAHAYCVRALPLIITEMDL
ncbi:hypothetical protein DI09_287p20 [Mitosporidium daphniae]|uniref:Uncharacterized protein n=1 Tax=Mitosporidium daphniae TaxID=1485682 RepID=A0A098VSF7_9MICR|nr:uncharacterized protein DI09_287p20 [Mitosporidium daphniae]KGG51749.1 hypothetical protein DI09_287p20 [Mitosporidium daphniae]|eukprot:XP_013238185.1 uncharacterized protein DI09_287p20 [Mitosporidium daphniae]